MRQTGHPGLSEQPRICTSAEWDFTPGGRKSLTCETGVVISLIWGKIV